MDLAMKEPVQYIKGEISTLHKIKEIAHKNFTREVCGFLGYDQNKNKYVIQVERNVAEDPSKFFMINTLIP